jgi:hypothetical protein
MRKHLPNRRLSENVEFERDGARYRMAVGYFPDGGVGEIFLNADRTDSLLDVLVNDAAILVSLALQHGVPLYKLAHAMKRDSSGTASSPIGVALDRITKPAVQS